MVYGFECRLEVEVVLVPACAIRGAGFQVPNFGCRVHGFGFRRFNTYPDNPPSSCGRSVSSGRFWVSSFLFKSSEFLIRGFQVPSFEGWVEDYLDNLLLLVDVALRQRHIFLRLEIELRRVAVHGSGVR